jgi:two-component system KDP operon response regulator KdpE
MNEPTSAVAPDLNHPAPDSAAPAGPGAEGAGKVLVIDDAPGIHQLLTMGLAGTGFEVFTALSGPEGLAEFIEHRPDVVVVDVLMPGMDGYELCRRLREISDAPIIMLSALRNESEIVRGLNAGADDYVTKPFSIGELTARIQAQLRRQRRAETAQRRLTFDGGHLTIDLDRRSVTRDGEEVHLSPTEFRLLAYLVANANRVVPHRELVSQLWGPEGERLGPYLKIYVRRLRQKVEPDPAEPRYIISRHGTGYVFQSEPVQ